MRRIFGFSVLSRLVSFSLCLLAIAPVQAQQSGGGEPYDPMALAAHFLNIHETPPLPDLTPAFLPGTVQSFFVAQAGSSTPVPVQATLAASVGDIAIWVEADIPFNAVALQGQANALAGAYAIMRHSGTYSERVMIPGLGSANSSAEDLPVPDVDADPHVFVIYLRDGVSSEAVYVPSNSLLASIAPSGISHQHETILVNTSPFPDVPLDDTRYVPQIARALVDLVMFQNNPSQAEWLRSALTDTLVRGIFSGSLDTNAISSYLNAPYLSLIDAGNSATAAAVNAMQGLFINYARQRYNAPLFSQLFLTPGMGVQALDTVFARQAITDPVSGEPVTARDLYADFALANVLNSPIGDGRYRHTVTTLDSSQQAAVAIVNQLGVTASGQAVGQFGTLYYAYTSASGEIVHVSFTGSPSAARLNMPSDRSLTDRYYWSGGVPGITSALTRRIDLSSVSQATLNFDVWHDLDAFWNYGYVTLSIDNGATWHILTPEGTASTINPYGQAYGAGFTGVSNPEPERAFPYLGVTFDTDGSTITDVVPNGPSAQAGIRTGDRVIGVNGTAWEIQPNILSVLADYRPGDTIRLLIQRGSDQRTLPVVLGEHPTRRVFPSPLWQPQTIDLTPYVGGEVLIGFEVVNLPGHDDNGMAIDHLSIPEIGWADDADTAEGWMLDGWQAVDNLTTQTFYVGAVRTGTSSIPPRISALIAPGDTATDGAWRFPLEEGESLLIAVSGMDDQTTSPAYFNLAFAADALATPETPNAAKR
ncbi:MAG: PDZ domain-containing protein [Anaerolineae bacterium]